MYIKGNVSFTINSHALQFEEQLISTFGVSSLAWPAVHPPLDPKALFGKSVEVALKIPQANLGLRTQARIMREETTSASHMALRFALSPEQATQLKQAVQTNGFYPTQFLRKYPRIPSSNKIQVFPLRAIGVPLDANHQQIVFEIGNVSPTGILIFSENPRTAQIIPGQRIHLSLEPRGWFAGTIQIECLVCRVMDDLHPVSQNITRHLGLKFLKFDPASRASFLELLKHILDGIKPK